MLVPYLGGGFGAGLRIWPHVILAALAARITGRPVKLVLTRPQMFTSVGHRPQTVQRLRLGATRDGTAGRRSTTRPPRRSAPEEANIGARHCGHAPRPTPAQRRHPRPAGPAEHSQPRLAAGPGQGRGQLRRWSPRSTSCPTHWAWTRSNCGCATTPRSTRSPACRGRARPCASATWPAPSDSAGPGATPRSGRCATASWLIGYGMAGVTFGWFQAPCQASISISRDGTAHVRSAATDIGTGTYTVATQLTAELLGLRTGPGASSRSVTATCRPRRSPAARAGDGAERQRSTPPPATCSRRSSTSPPTMRVAAARPQARTRSPSPTAASTSSPTPRPG